MTSFCENKRNSDVSVVFPYLQNANHSVRVKHLAEMFTLHISNKRISSFLCEFFAKWWRITDLVPLDKEDELVDGGQHLSAASALHPHRYPPIVQQQYI